MGLTFFDYEIPLLRSLIQKGDSARTEEVYSLVEDIMSNILKDHPEEYERYKNGEVIIKNKIRWAREYLKRKGQLDGSIRGIWTITNIGKERLRLFDTTRKDPDEGKAPLEGIDSFVAETGEDPEVVFDRIDMMQEHGDILGIRGIVYEPINEQGVILLFAAICYELGFRIEAIRTKFPDAQLIRKNNRGTFSKCFAEFEFKSSNYKLHNHPINGCDLVICWENDWLDCPLEVLCLKDKISELRTNKVI